MFAAALEKRSVRISLRGGGTGNLTSHAEYHIARQHMLSNYTLLKWSRSDCVSARRDASYGERFHICRRQACQFFLVLTLYGPDEFIASLSRGSRSQCTSKALRLLGLSIASQDRYSITGFCSIMTELVYPFSITAVLHLASNHIVVKICRRMPHPIFVPKSLERPCLPRTWLSGARSRANHSLYIGNEIRLNPEA
jgi:hypothetical protein